MNNTSKIFDLDLGNQNERDFLLDDYSVIKKSDRNENSLNVSKQEIEDIIKNIEHEENNSPRKDDPNDGDLRKSTFGMGFGFHAQIERTMKQNSSKEHINPFKNDSIKDSPMKQPQSSNFEEEKECENDSLSLSLGEENLEEEGVRLVESPEKSIDVIGQQEEYEVVGFTPKDYLTNENEDKKGEVESQARDSSQDKVEEKKEEVESQARDFSQDKVEEKKEEVRQQSPDNSGINNELTKPESQKIESKNIDRVNSLGEYTTSNDDQKQLRSLDPEFDQHYKLERMTKIASPPDPHFEESPQKQIKEKNSPELSSIPLKLEGSINMKGLLLPSEKEITEPIQIQVANTILKLNAPQKESAIEEIEDFEKVDSEDEFVELGNIEVQSQGDEFVTEEYAHVTSDKTSALQSPKENSPDRNLVAHEEPKCPLEQSPEINQTHTAHQNGADKFNEENEQEISVSIIQKETHAEVEKESSNDIEITIRELVDEMLEQIEIIIDAKSQIEVSNEKMLDGENEQQTQVIENLNHNIAQEEMKVQDQANQEEPSDLKENMKQEDQLEDEEKIIQIDHQEEDEETQTDPIAGEHQKPIQSIDQLNQPNEEFPQDQKEDYIEEHQVEPEQFEDEIESHEHSTQAENNKIHSEREEAIQEPYILQEVEEQEQEISQEFADNPEQLNDVLEEDLNPEHDFKQINNSNDNDEAEDEDDDKDKDVTQEHYNDILQQREAPGDLVGDCSNEFVPVAVLGDRLDEQIQLEIKPVVEDQSITKVDTDTKDNDVQILQIQEVAEVKVEVIKNEEIIEEDTDLCKKEIKEEDSTLVSLRLSVDPKDVKSNLIDRERLRLEDSKTPVKMSLDKSIDNEESEIIDPGTPYPSDHSNSFS